MTANEQKWSQNTVYTNQCKKYDALASCFKYQCYLQVLVAVYVLTVVYLVRRQLKMVREEKEVEVVNVIMANEMGETVIKDMDKVLNDQQNILL